MKTYRFTPLFLVNQFLVYTIVLVFILQTSPAVAQVNDNQENRVGINNLHLSARVVNKNVILSWTTKTEINNNHFEIEYSNDASVFKTVGLVLDGFEVTGTGSKLYLFKEPIYTLKENKAVYYRLKQVNKNNEVLYGPVLEVALNSNLANYYPYLFSNSQHIAAYHVNGSERLMHEFFYTND